jgi:hypothetical protein
MRIQACYEIVKTCKREKQIHVRRIRQAASAHAQKTPLIRSVYNWIRESRNFF